jgi:hypothetical protein
MSRRPRHTTHAPNPSSAAPDLAAAAPDVPHVTPSDPVSEEQISALAYSRYTGRGCQHGFDREDWESARRELTGERPL